MKHHTLFLSMFLIIILSVTLAGCGSANEPTKSKETKKSSTEGKNRSGEWVDPNYDPNATVTTEDNWKDPGDDWKDPSYDPSATASTVDNWKDPGDDWKDPSNPAGTTVSTEPAQTEPIVTQPIETGPSADGYRHEIDGWVFYTQHDINDYIELEADGKYHFYVTKMATDIFGGTVFKCSSTQISFDVNTSEKGPEIFFTFGTYDDTNAKGNGDWRGFELVYYGYSCFVKCQKSPDEKVYYIEDLVYKVNYEIAVLSLYICENVEGWYSLGMSNHSFWYDVASHLSTRRFFTWDTYGQPK